jgi:hypothetical protein
MGYQTLSSFVDSRGNTIYGTTLEKKDLKFLESIRKGWSDVSDADILTAKQKIVGAFDFDASNVMGMACRDFIYIYHANKHDHFFAWTGGGRGTEKQHNVYRYHGECDLCFSTEAEFEIIKLMLLN